jgi:hypothetical protein
MGRVAIRGEIYERGKQVAKPADRKFKPVLESTREMAWRKSRRYESE